MSRSWSNQQIEEFARNVLGCGCPDKVFEAIEVGRVDNRELGFAISRVDIGKTLLVYIMRPTSAEDLRDAMEMIAAEGRRDRDSNGFNRFRLVVAGEPNELEGDTAAKVFAAAIGADDKMHLHFVGVALVDGL